MSWRDKVCCDVLFLFLRMNLRNMLYVRNTCLFLPHYLGFKNYRRLLPEVGYVRRLCVFYVFYCEFLGFMQRIDCY